MSEENRAEPSSQDRIKLFMGISPPPSNAKELAYQQKCFQSLADLKTQRDTGSSVVFCFNCWAKWLYMIKECPLCHSKTPEDNYCISRTKSSGMCGKISENVDNPIRVTKTCKTCFDDYEGLATGCGHLHCGKCAEKWFCDIHDCLFCGKKISLIKLAENQPDDKDSIPDDEVRIPEVQCRCGKFKISCSECLRRWRPGDSKCPYCFRSANKQDEPSSDVDNISENQEEVLKDHEDQNPISKIAMEDVCSSHHEIENPVNTSTNQASTSNTFDSFGNEKQEQVPANEIDPTTSANETVIEASVSDNRELSASENVSNVNETYRGLETSNDGHVSKLLEDATIGPESLVTLGQKGDDE